MTLTPDESRALAFIAGLLLLSSAVRMASAREPVDLPGGGLDLAAHVEETRAAVAEEERASRPLGEGERIDPNTADATELDRLPRVGPTLAKRIVADRVEDGPFRSVEDLRRVRGVGARVLREARPFLVLPDGERVGAGASRRLPGQPGPRPPGEVVDVNRADAAALATLPGIGPALAERIIAHRDSAGPFRDVDGLTAVKGIGPATVSRLRERARAGGL